MTLKVCANLPDESRKPTLDAMDDIAIIAQTCGRSVAVRTISKVRWSTG